MYYQYASAYAARPTYATYDYSPSAYYDYASAGAYSYSYAYAGGAQPATTTTYYTYAPERRPAAEPVRRYAAEPTAKPAERRREAPHH